MKLILLTVLVLKFIVGQSIEASLSDATGLTNSELDGNALLQIGLAFRTPLIPQSIPAWRDSHPWLRITNTLTACTPPAVQCGTPGMLHIIYGRTSTVQSMLCAHHRYLTGRGVWLRCMRHASP